MKVRIISLGISITFLNYRGYNNFFFQISKADQKELRGLKGDEYGIAFNRVLARHILQERHRHGGDFVVAWTNADNKEGRDAIRKIVGPELIFVVLTKQRNTSLLKNPFPDSDSDSENEKQGLIYSLAQIDDKNKVIDIEVTDEMKVENVANVVVELVDYVKQKKYQDRFFVCVHKGTSSHCLNFDYY